MHPSDALAQPRDVGGTTIGALLLILAGLGLLVAMSVLDTIAAFSSETGAVALLIIAGGFYLLNRSLGLITKDTIIGAGSETGSTISDLPDGTGAGADSGGD